jgi:hypothetical protein
VVEASLEILAERIDHLEHENRRLDVLSRRIDHLDDETRRLTRANRRRMWWGVVIVANLVLAIFLIFAHAIHAL